MSNCKAGLNLNTFWVNIRKESDVVNSLKSLLEVDCDLTENESYFRDDTIKLGYENEAERIVAEYISNKGLPKTLQEYKDAVTKVSESISSQEYFGMCEISFVTLKQNIVVVAFATGGAYE